MAIELGSDDAFVLHAFRVIPEPDTVNFPRQLDTETWVLNGFPLKKGKTWGEWMGTIWEARLQNANTFVFAKGHSDEPMTSGYPDQEVISSRADAALYSIFLTRRLKIQGKVQSLWGYRNERLAIKSVGERRQPTWWPEDDPEPLDGTAVRALPKIYEGLRTIYAPKAQYFRLQRGFECILRTLNEKTPEEVVHQSVRALDALVNSRQGQGKKDFVDRGKYFVTSRQNPELSPEEWLEHMYKARSKVEHMHPLEVLYPGDARPIWELKAQRLRRQCSALARGTYITLLSNQELLSRFTNEEIMSYWSRSENEKLTDWDPGVDIEKIPLIPKNQTLTTD